MNRLKLEAIISAVAIYLIIVVGILFGTIYEPLAPKSKTYVAKKSDTIEVSLGKPTKNKQHKKSAKKKRKPNKNIAKKKPKKIRNIKKQTKKVAKYSSKKITKKSKQNASSLFKNISSNFTKKTLKSSTVKKSAKSIKKVDKGKGVVNSYFARIQHTLEGWPAQSNFAGEKIKVELTVYPSGLFNYKLLSSSLNPEFNQALKDYLKQLKRFGFGAHSNPKPYKIIVEFIAKG